MPLTLPTRKASCPEAGPGKHRAARPAEQSLRRLAQDNQAYRKQGQVWFEGEHLIDAVLNRGASVQTLVCAQSHWPHLPTLEQSLGDRQVILPDALFQAISGLESPSHVGVVLNLPQAPAIQPGVATVVLDQALDVKAVTFR